MKRILLAIATMVFLALSASAQVVGRQDITTTNLPDDNGLSAALPFLIPVQNISCQNFPSQVTFRLYPKETATTAVWQETQTVFTNGGSYAHAALMGLTTNGLPIDVFSGGTALWLGVQCEGEAEQGRLMMSSVPYAVKSLDSANLGGRPAADYALVGSVNTSDLSSALSNETSRAQMVEGNLVADLATEVTTRQNAVSTLQASEQTNMLHTDSQLAALNTVVASLQAQITALQAQLVAMQAAQTSSTTTSTSLANTNTSNVVTTTDVVVNPAPTTSIDLSPRTSRSSRLTKSFQ
jgi:hypothetical protein